MSAVATTVRLVRRAWSTCWPRVPTSPRSLRSTRLPCPAAAGAANWPGSRIPRDFSVAGVAARHWAEAFRPPLTAADVPIVDMGTDAVALLMESIAAPRTPPRRHRLHSPRRSRRGSSNRTRAGSLTAGPSPTSATDPRLGERRRFVRGRRG